MAYLIGGLAGGIILIGIGVYCMNKKMQEKETHEGGEELMTPEQQIASKRKYIQQELITYV